ncbi:hypothetical protein SISNIDRAFT_468996 [Sistotremastrum niveocremeum HHB9708]|uniref:Transmembrane protein n=1 Tax=Sistotremastrum niveocremeum HHB9708 TaxID=1314777 RepID=A0A164QJY4_9AGAM|nr:hypothetical protein SISNIDRAFT_468996 [Sistotremastrum niveocremeum HHB9708]
MFKFTASFFLALFALLAVATSFASASAVPVSSLDTRNPQDICKLVGIDITADLNAIVAAKNNLVVDVFADLNVDLKLCVDAIIDAKATIGADVVVALTVALFANIEAALVGLDLAVVANLIAQIDLDVTLKAILDAVVLIKVDANVEVGLASTSLALAVLQVFADIKVFVFLKDLDLSAIVIAALGLVGIL